MTRILLLALCLASLADYDVDCYQRCQQEACREPCSESRLRERPEDCKACIEGYDRVCQEQCKAKAPPVGRCGEDARNANHEGME